MARVKGLDLDPSVYGDHGFWVPTELAAKYTAAAEELKSFKDVSAPESLMGIMLMLARTLGHVIHKREHNQEKGKIKITD
jgi:hypothetical protein